MPLLYVLLSKISLNIDHIQFLLLTGGSWRCCVFPWVWLSDSPDCKDTSREHSEVVRATPKDQQSEERRRPAEWTICCLVPMWFKSELQARLNVSSSCLLQPLNSSPQHLQTPSTNVQFSELLHSEKLINFSIYTKFMWEDKILLMANVWNLKVAVVWGKTSRAMWGRLV